jgi:hypothetical protein
MDTQLSNRRVCGGVLGGQGVGRCSRANSPAVDRDLLVRERSGRHDPTTTSYSCRDLVEFVLGDGELRSVLWSDLGGSPSCGVGYYRLSSLRHMGPQDAIHVFGEDHAVARLKSLVLLQIGAISTIVTQPSNKSRSPSAFQM